ncbi:RNA-binding S4 domain-containing protein [Neorhizobium petrolearium]|uniref:RNA-binding S4 domain-containing protein n=1 Tax=Neorhizobium petrolearium TaxID=515361 RepID=UPI003F165164
MTEKEPQDGSRQRIDKWLFFARIVKSRSLAQSLIAAGAVTVNGETCSQPSRAIKPGDRVELLLERRDVVLIVRAGGVRRGPFEEARLLYDELTPPPGERKRLTPFERAQRGLGTGGAGGGDR